MRNKLISPLYLNSYSTDLSETPHLSLTAQALQGYKFGCDRSITKDTLLEEQSIFSTASCLLFHESFWK